MTKRLTMLLVGALTAAGCTAGSDATTSTTTGGGPTTTPTTEPTTTTTTMPTDTTIRGQAVTDYQTVARLSTANGEVLHIVVPPGGYTDIDLFNFLADLKDADPDLWGVEVFDDPAAPAAFGVAEGQRTEEQDELLRLHHLISLVSGDTVRYQGPFSSFGETILGS